MRPSKMLAAMWVGPLQMEMREVDVPEHSAEEVLVKVVACGQCHTDVQWYLGDRTLTSRSRGPRILGHEIAGIVEEVGSSVKDVDVGDRVAIAGSFGGYAQYVAAPAQSVWEMPEGIGFDEAALVDGLACCVHGIKIANPCPGERVAVLGPGPAGLCYLQLAKLQGAAWVVLTGTKENRLELGRRLGADETVNIRHEDARQKIGELTGGKGVDLVIEASGSPEAARDAMHLARDGGRVLIYGVYGEPGEIDLDEIMFKQLTVLGSVYGQDCYVGGMDLLVEKKVDVLAYLTHRFPLERTPEAFRLAASKPEDFIKAVIDVAEG
jgi:L-iditol 2-dehydrogenase